MWFMSMLMPLFLCINVKNNSQVFTHDARAPYLHNVCSSLNEAACSPWLLQRTTVGASVVTMSRFQTNCFFRRSFLLGIPTPGAPPAEESFIAEASVVPDADAVHAASLAVLPLYNCTSIDAVSALRPNEAPRAATLVDAHTSAAVEARDGTLAVFTPGTIVPTPAGAGILLNALPPVQALFCADSSLTVRSLVPDGAVADSRCHARSSIHALWIAQRCPAVATHVSLRALADLLCVATASVGTFSIAFGVWTIVSALFLQAQSKWRAAQVAAPLILDTKSDPKRRHSSDVAPARQEHLEHFCFARNLSFGLNRYHRVLQNGAVKGLQDVEVVIIVRPSR